MITLILIISTLDGPKKSYIYTAQNEEQCIEHKANLVERIKKDPGTDLIYIDCVDLVERFQ